MVLCSSSCWPPEKMKMVWIYTELFVTTTQKKPLYCTTELFTTPIHTRPCEFAPKYSFNIFKRVHCVQSICNELIKVRKIKSYPPSIGKKVQVGTDNWIHLSHIVIHTQVLGLICIYDLGIVKWKSIICPPMVLILKIETNITLQLARCWFNNNHGNTTGDCTHLFCIE
jgi:hypothetical protein